MTGLKAHDGGRCPHSKGYSTVPDGYTTSRTGPQVRGGRVKGDVSDRVDDLITDDTWRVVYV